MERVEAMGSAALGRSRFGATVAPPATPGQADVPPPGSAVGEKSHAPSAGVWPHGKERDARGTGIRHHGGNPGPNPAAAVESQHSTDFGLLRVTERGLLPLWWHPSGPSTIPRWCGGNYNKKGRRWKTSRRLQVARPAIIMNCRESIQYAESVGTLALMNVARD